MICASSVHDPYSTDPTLGNMSLDHADNTPPSPAPPQSQAIYIIQIIQIIQITNRIYPEKDVDNSDQESTIGPIYETAVKQHQPTKNVGA